MSSIKLKICVAVFAVSLCGRGYGQNDDALKLISLANLDAFVDPPKNWVIAGDATADFSKEHDLRPAKGSGAVVNDFSRNNRMHLYTKDEFGDVELDLDFMMAKNSNAGVYLQGRYEIQLLDSWKKLNASSSDVGGIYSRWDAQRGSFEGTAPVMNVARAPGLWQHLQLTFRAPRFDDKGVKIRDARFEEVYLNGVLIQQAANVTGPTNSAMFTDEKSRGPLMLQGDHGPVAFKNIRYKELAPASDTSAVPAGDRYWETRNPITINPTTKNYLLRSYFEYGDKTLTHVISVGSPAALNYAYDLKQGALIKIWRGKFLDVTRMWLGRGEPQLARPLGSVIALSDAPAVAVLADDKAPWPDSIAFDDLQMQGYSLDRYRTPVFSYLVKGAGIKDSIACDPEGTGITRAITAANPPANLFCRVIEGKRIDRLSDDLYTVDDRAFYIKIDKKFKPIVRPSVKGSELIVRYDAAAPLIYTLIW